MMEAIETRKIPIMLAITFPRNLNESESFSSHVMFI